MHCTQSNHRQPQILENKLNSIKNEVARAKKLTQLGTTKCVGSVCTKPPTCYEYERGDKGQQGESKTHKTNLLELSWVDFDSRTRKQKSTYCMDPVKDFLHMALH